MNLGLITYGVDLEQLVVADPSDFAYPLWPPAPLIDLVHAWGDAFDPLLMARPAWYRATIWIDQLLFGPFYAFALVAFVRGRSWIRLPALVWSGLMFGIVSIILFEELLGPYASPRPAIVVAANLPWWLMPVLTVWRMRRDRPFVAQPAGQASSGVGSKR